MNRLRLCGCVVLLMVFSLTAWPQAKRRASIGQKAVTVTLVRWPYT